MSVRDNIPKPVGSKIHVPSLAAASIALPSTLQHGGSMVDVADVPKADSDDDLPWDSRRLLRVVEQLDTFVLQHIAGELHLDDPDGCVACAVRRVLRQVLKCTDAAAKSSLEHMIWKAQADQDAGVTGERVSIAAQAIRTYLRSTSSTSGYSNDTFRFVQREVNICRVLIGSYYSQQEVSNEAAQVLLCKMDRLAAHMRLFTEEVSCVEAPTCSSVVAAPTCSSVERTIPAALLQ